MLQQLRSAAAAVGALVLSELLAGLGARGKRGRTLDRGVRRHLAALNAPLLKAGFRYTFSYDYNLLGDSVEYFGPGGDVHGCSFERTVPPDPRDISSNWASLILPFLEQEALFEQFDFTVAMNHANNDAANAAVVSAFICPTDPQGKQPVLTARCLNGGGRFEAHLSWYLASMGPVVCDTCNFCPAGTTSSPSSYCCQGTSCGAGATAPGDVSSEPAGSCEVPGRAGWPFQHHHGG